MYIRILVLKLFNVNLSLKNNKLFYIITQQKTIFIITTVMYCVFVFN